MSNEKPKRAFRGIWIPKELWLAEDLTLQEKVFLAEIDSLNRGEGCYASNSYFARFFGLSKKRVSIIINSLCQKERIKAEIDVQAGNKRRLWTYPRKEGDPIPKNGDTLSPETRTPIPESGKTPIPGNGDHITYRDNKGENIEDNSENSSPELSQDWAYRLLRQYGVAEKRSKALIYEQLVPPESIEEAVKNGLAKQNHQKDFVLTPGYIVAALNGARKEGKTVKPTRASKALQSKLRRRERRKTRPPMGPEEFEKKREKQLERLAAAS